MPRRPFGVVNRVSFARRDRPGCTDRAAAADARSQPRERGAFPLPSPPPRPPVARHMSDLSAPAVSPADIEARQDDLLRQLDALEKRIARVLADYAASGQSPPRPKTSSGAGAISQPLAAAETPGVALPFSAVAVTTVAAATR